MKKFLVKENKAISAKNRIRGGFGGAACGCTHAICLCEGSATRKKDSRLGRISNPDPTARLGRRNIIK